MFHSKGLSCSPLCTCLSVPCHTNHRPLQQQASSVVVIAAVTAAAVVVVVVQIKDEISKYKVGAPARVGLLAPNDVFIPAGGTGMDPSQTSFFQVGGGRGEQAATTQGGEGLCGVNKRTS